MLILRLSSVVVTLAALSCINGCGGDDDAASDGAPHSGGSAGEGAGGQPSGGAGGSPGGGGTNAQSPHWVMGYYTAYHRDLLAPGEICYDGGVTAPNQSTEGGIAIRGGDNDYPLSELMGASGAYDPAYRQWDADARAAYLSLPTPERHGCQYVSFDDADSIMDKGAFMKAEGYGGTIVWTINQGYLRSRDEGERNLLFQALKAGFLG